MSQQRVVWALIGYRKGEDAPAVTVELRGITVEALRVTFDRPDDDPMAYNYQVSDAEQLVQLTRFVEAPLDASEYDYYVEPYAEDAP